MKCMQFSDVQNEPFIYCLCHLMKVQFVFFSKSQDIEYEIHCFDCRLPICQFECVCSLRLHGRFSTPALCVCVITRALSLPFALLFTFAFNMYLTGFKGIVWSCKDNRPRKQLVPQTKAIVTKCLSLRFYSGNVPLVPTSEQQRMSPFINMEELSEHISCSPGTGSGTRGPSNNNPRHESKFAALFGGSQSSFANQVMNSDQIYIFSYSLFHHQPFQHCRQK